MSTGMRRIRVMVVITTEEMKVSANKRRATVMGRYHGRKVMMIISAR
jgi:hypothetical protein